MASSVMGSRSGPSSQVPDAASPLRAIVHLGARDHLIRARTGNGDGPFLPVSDSDGLLLASLGDRGEAADPQPWEEDNSGAFANVRDGDPPQPADQRVGFVPEIPLATFHREHRYTHSSGRALSAGTLRGRRVPGSSLLPTRASSARTLVAGRPSSHDAIAAARSAFEAADALEAGPGAQEFGHKPKHDKDWHHVVAVVLALVIDVGAAIAAGLYGRTHDLKAVEYSSWPIGAVVLSGHSARLAQLYGYSNRYIDPFATICCKIEARLLALLGFIIAYFGEQVSNA